ncbi:fatty acyl-AMP ligase [Solihabitans fulvus]|nr:fatty acyl-AMP ligase [Solihabitans fulvus]
MIKDLAGLLRERAARSPERVPLIFLPSAADGADVPLGYAELDRRSRALAGALQQRIPAGSRVLLACPTGPDFAAAFFGCLYAGVVPVPVPPPLPGAMADRFHVVRADCVPELLITVDAWAQLLRPVGLPILAADTVAADEATAFRPAQIHPEDTAYLQYTSGTTADPRGVVVSHANALANLRAVSAATRATSADRVVGWLPLFHDMGLVSQLLHPVYEDFQAFLLQPQDFVCDPGRWLREMSRRRATSGSLPGFAYDMLLRRVPADQRAALDLSGWRLALCAAEALDPVRMREFAAGFEPAGFDPAAFYPTYGMAEAVVMVCAGVPGRPAAPLLVDRAALALGRLSAADTGMAVVSSGRPLAGMSVRIVDPHGRLPLPSGQVGEILIAGPSVTRGYWNRSATLVEIDGVGHLPTGDLGAFLGGELYVLGRTADLIVVDGGAHYPSDVERTAAAAHPGIRSRTCAAFAVPDGFVLLAETDGATDRDEAAAAVAAAVHAEHGMRLTEVVLVDRGTVPFTTSGKLRRGACRIRYLAGDFTARTASAR